MINTLATMTRQLSHMLHNGKCKVNAAERERIQIMIVNAERELEFYAPDLDAAIEKHREYIQHGLNPHDALYCVTQNLNSFHELRDSRQYSKQFCESIQHEIERLNIESSALHVVIREQVKQ